MNPHTAVLPVAEDRDSQSMNIATVRVATSLAGGHLLTLTRAVPCSDERKETMTRAVVGRTIVTLCAAAILVLGPGAEPRAAFASQPTCGFKESAEFYDPDGSLWKKARITYRLEIPSSDLDVRRQREIIRAAFDRWAAVVPLIFVETDGAADIRISFVTGDHGDNSPFKDGEGHLAHAFYPRPRLGELAGDIHFNDGYLWQDGRGYGGYDLLRTCVHEIGHSLGLRHTFVPDSAMNESYPFADAPQADDRDGIRYVYREHIWLAFLYRDLLGRPYDPVGLDHWVRTHFTHGSPLETALRFTHSLEHSTRLASELYPWLLDRAPDTRGLADWSSKLSQGMSRQDAILGFLLSREYRDRHASPGAFVSSLYRRLWSRAPTRVEIFRWELLLLQGLATYDSAARYFLNGDPFCHNYVQGLYRRFLRRDPDVAGRQYWTNAIRGGRSHQWVIASILGSEEYRNAATRWW